LTDETFGAGRFAPPNVSPRSRVRAPIVIAAWSNLR